MAFRGGDARRRRRRAATRGDDAEDDEARGGGPREVADAGVTPLPTPLVVEDDDDVHRAARGPMPTEELMRLAEVEEEAVEVEARREMDAGADHRDDAAAAAAAGTAITGIASHTTRISSPVEEFG